MPKITLFVFIILLFVTISFGQINQPNLSKNIDSYLKQAADFGFAGVVLVAVDGKITFQKSYGMADQDKKIPNNITTVFDIGSISKQFTAAAIVKLEMQGKLKTDDSITKYLEGVPEDKAQVTIHQLLTHTAGFPEYSGGDYEKSERDETIARILKVPLAFKPDSAYSYSNAGYSVLAAIIEKVSGQNYESFLNENLFKPVRMTQTGYVIPKFDKATLPHGYVLGKDQKTPLDHLWSEQGPYWNLMGNGAILSTAEDLFKWYQALLDTMIFSVEAKKKMFTPNLNNYGYGWDIGQTNYGQTIGHNGGNDFGFTAHLRWFPEKKVCVIVLSNSGYYFDDYNYSNMVGKKITGLIFGEKIPSQQTVKFTKQNPQNLKNFEGTYTLPSGEMIEIKEKLGQLFAFSIGQDATNLLSQTALNPIFEEACKKSNDILQGMVKKDFLIFKTAIEKEDVAARYQTYLEKKMQEWETKEGAFKGFQILGTVFDWWGDNSTPITFVKMNYEKKPHLFRFHWKDGKIIAIGGEGIPNPGMTPLQSISPNEFAGWHLSFAKPIRIKLKQAPNNKTVMTIIANGKTVEAIKN